MTIQPLKARRPPVEERDQRVERHSRAHEPDDSVLILAKRDRRVLEGLHTHRIRRQTRMANAMLHR